MRFVVVSAILLGTSLLAANSASPDGGSVSVKGVHLCCGGCQSIAEDALSDLDGVTSTSADLNTKVISFKAADKKAAEAGIKALAEAGFFGTATFNKEPLEFPTSGAKKGAKANTITLTNVHLCCTACVTASQQSLQTVRGVNVIDIDRNEETIKLTGDGISILEAIGALNKAGFYCRLKAPNAEPKKP